MGQVAQDTIKVGYTSAPPFIIEFEDRLEGINIWLWEKVANDLNMEFTYEKMEFKGMLNALENGAIDMSINPLTITSERSKKMEFTDSFYASNSTIAIAEASTLQKFKSFVFGFFNVNFLKGFFLLLFIILLFGVLAWFFERNKNKEQFRTGFNGIWDGIWWSAVTLTTVGYGDKAPKSKLGKVTSLVLMFGGLLFISGLTASIASSLTINQLNSNPDSFNEFKNKTVGSIKNSSSNEFLKNHFFKEIKVYDGVVPSLKELNNNKIDAVIYDEPILKYRIQQDSTLNKLSVLPIKFDVQFYAFGLTKNNIELEQRISQKILEIIESQEWQIILNEYGLSEI
ncbi:substrate-binding periplasmic protein [Maribacter sp. HTCC2170]|uniref:substrate-binding periplasmic protein n=1 Tax=Maribacter sp. (strain HTCC2170 / KCCM 42371) TaxID=313603 RepID=UPI00006AFCA1|nr:transporter substrate-binding domain-containing protein [Maribacter sp. HTCC2170]EAR01463.1 extracellular solute-binding protein, family 3 [Maribacter sp. HTCC2170]